MTWTNKIKVNDVLLFCKTWKNREEIMKQFKLSNIEAWHCVRWIGKLSDVSVIKKVGLTGRAYMYRTRSFAIEKILEEIKLISKTKQTEKDLVSMVGKDNIPKS